MNVALNCKQCGDSFEIRKAEHNRQLKKGRQHFFCSLSCCAAYGNTARIAPVIKKNCKHCGGEFETKQDRHEADFCGKRCASLGSVTAYRRARARLSGQAHANNFSNAKALLGRENKKYRLLIPLLTERQIRYEFEKRIDKFVFDLALEDQRVLIEFDGPEHRTPKGTERDAVRDRSAELLGWKVLRIPVKTGQIIPASMLEAVL